MTDPMPFRPSVPGTQPSYDVPGYRSTAKRHPTRSLHRFAQTITETTGPAFTPERCPPITDLTGTRGGEAKGERIVVAGRVIDEDNRPVPHTMIEVWQANAAGRYDHPGDRHDAPLDPNFHGAGRVFTDAEGRYKLVTITPGAYPWPNGPNAWRARHIHFSLFGNGFASRLITQMYFPGDPLLATDPIYHGIPEERARRQLISSFDLDLAVPDWALGFRFDIVLRGRGRTPVEA
jgi:protocatechuate 3,4-dioxygenase, beta subunit